MKKSGKVAALTSVILTGLGLGLAFRNKLKKNKAEKDFPQLGSFCRVQGCNLHYFSEGKGPEIVFLHQENGDIYDFYLSPIWNRLKHDYRLTAFDRPGYGYSIKADWKSYGFRNQGEIIHSAVKSLGLSKPLIVSYGESAGIALSMLMEHDDDYKGAVLIEDRSPRKENISDKLVSVPILGKIYLWTILPVIAENKAKTKVKNSILKGELAEKNKSFENIPSRLLNNSENKKFMDVSELEKISSFHTDIDKPVTVIHGKYNINSEDYQQLLDNLNLEEVFSKINIVNLKDASELPDIMKSDEVFEEIKKLA